MRRLRVVLVVATLLPAAACTSATAPATDALKDDAVTVASFDFPESRILGELYAQALERRGFRVIRQLDLGPRELVEPALEEGLVELVPEYSGSLLEFLTRGSTTASANLREVREALESSLTLRGLVQLRASPAQDRNGFAVSRAFADSFGLRTLSDLASGPDLVLGGPPECQERPLCLPGLEATYGLMIEDFVALDLSGPISAEALVRGVVDVALILTTSAQLAEHDFVILRDDRRLQPAEHVTPILHETTLERFGPELSATINEVSAKLTTRELRNLNAAVEIDGATPEDTVAAWLDANGLPTDGR